MRETKTGARRREGNSKGKVEGGEGGASGCVEGERGEREDIVAYRGSEVRCFGWFWGEGTRGREESIGQ